tara:strand:- start:140 stop:430 length:291 start_codon:yes stop_codon:yes gene_type:complete
MFTLSLELSRTNNDESVIDFLYPKSVNNIVVSLSLSLSQKPVPHSSQYKEARFFVTEGERNPLFSPPCWFSPIFGDLFLSFSNLVLSLARHYFLLF